jgi:hypothetical protein
MSILTALFGFNIEIEKKAKPNSSFYADFFKIDQIGSVISIIAIQADHESL